MSHMSYNESHWVMVSHMTHKSHVKFICFNASMLNEFDDRLIIILIIILQGALIDQHAVAAGKKAQRTLDPRNTIIIVY